MEGSTERHGDVSVRNGELSSACKWGICWFNGWKHCFMFKFNI